ncbi:MAG: hypothetical protein IJJ23_05940 [Clostridia bacterium]|nr:hypothetical protein [Clostridia bacterium]
MRKLIAVMISLCLLCGAAAAAGQTPFTVRNGVAFGMVMDDVIATESVPYQEIENETTRGPVTFVELEYEDITENGLQADLKYMFVDDALAAVVFSYDEEDAGVSYDVVRESLVGQYGESSALDLALLGNGVYALDDHGRLEGQTEAWTIGDVMIVLERDEDDFDVAFVDLAAQYVK